MLKKQRLAKIIANSGLCSRRVAEELILNNKVNVNNVTINSCTTFVDNNDYITVNNIALTIKEAPLQLWIYHKPRGLITSYKDEKNRPTVFDALPNNLPRVVSIGRLDYNSEGLLLLTNNGKLANLLSSPQLKLQRVYHVKVFGTLYKTRLDTLSYGITIDGIIYKPIRVKILSQHLANAWLEFTLTEGKNREIRNICNYLELKVNRLIRIAFGPFKLDDLKIGELKKAKLNFLKFILPLEILQNLHISEF